jgi:GNAT superfamily N-acetyltransferase
MNDSVDQQGPLLAVEPAFRGHGLGTWLLDVGIERARLDGATGVWARARDTALDFYRRHGFVVMSDGYVEPTTRLSHHDVILAIR